MTMLSAFAAGGALDRRIRPSPSLHREAEQGRAYQMFVPEEERDNPDEAYKTEYGYLVTACPLYEREHKWFTHKEAVDEICKTLGIVDSSFRHRPAQYMRRYETITGEKLPVWMWSAIECK